MPSRERQIINSQAWVDIAPQVRDLFRTRQRELLAEAAVTRVPTRGRRRVSAARTSDFRGFIAALLEAGELNDAPEETLDLIAEFLQRATASTRLRLLTHLQTRPELLGDHAGDLARFG